MKMSEWALCSRRSPSPALPAAVLAAWSIAWLAACAGPSEAPRGSERGERPPTAGEAAAPTGEAEGAAGPPAAPAFRPPEASPPYLEARIGSINRGVLVLLDNPDAIVGGLPDNTMTRVHPDGRVIYRRYGDLNVLVADPVFRDSRGEWTYPEDPAENDEWLATPACRGVMEGHRFPDAIGWFWIDPDGRIAYRCPYRDRDPPIHYVDGPTVEMGEGVIRSLGTESRALRLGGRWGETWGIDSRGEFVPIDKPKAWDRRGPGPFLADHEGFLAVLANKRDRWDTEGLGSLYRIYYDGASEEIGAYGRPEVSLMPNAVVLTLAPGGIIYAKAERSSEELVLRFSPSQEPGRIVYRGIWNDPRDIDSVTRWGD